MWSALHLVMLATPASAEEGLPEPVAIELVIAIDTSASIDRREFALQVEGLAAALRHPDVLEAVENLGRLGAAVTVMQFGGDGGSRTSVPWMRLEGERDAKALAYLVTLTRRWQWASETSIAAAIEAGVKGIDQNGYEGLRRIIDVSGDGRHNGASDLGEARARANALGIVINGLPIAADDAGLSAYFRDQVIQGTGAFVQPAEGFEDYARAIREKLIREFQPPES